jgi:hypothetical protein
MIRSDQLTEIYNSYLSLNKLLLTYINNNSSIIPDVTLSENKYHITCRKKTEDIINEGKNKSRNRYY